MAKQNASERLKESIRLLEARQIVEGRIFREQLKLTYESLKPANLIRSTVNELAGNHGFKNGLFETLLSVSSGYLAKKMLANSKSNLLVKLLSEILRYGVAGLVSKNAGSIRNLFLGLFEKFLKLTVKNEESAPGA